MAQSVRKQTKVPKSPLIRRYMSIASAVDLLRRRQLTLVDPTSWDDRNDRYFMALYKEHRKVGGLYAACATTSTETYHHWRVFSDAADGACVEITRKSLEPALAEMGGVRFGTVSYLRLDQVEKLTKADAMNLPFVKRWAFEPEDEYRIIIETARAQAPVIGLELPLEWIARIRLNPWLPSRVADSLKITLNELKDCGGIEIIRSHLIDSARWKRAGDKVVGRKTPPALTVRRLRKLPKG